MGNGRKALALVCALLLLLVSALPLLFGAFFGERLDAGLAGRTAVFALGIVAFAVVAGLVLGYHGYRVTGDKLQVRGPAGRVTIPLDKITSVSKVRRVSDSERERVQVAYRDAGKSRTIVLTPRQPMRFVHDLVARCPQLTAYDETRLTRTEGFGKALAEIGNE